MNFRERILGHPFVYRIFKLLIVPRGVLERLVREHYVVPDGGSVLDLGCGFGDYAPLLSKTASYVGVDHNPHYIETAKKLHSGPNTRFFVADVNDSEVSECGPFDLVMISGVLHHLDDDAVRQLAQTVALLIKPGGQFVALEAVFDPDQRLVARLVVASDRGRFVRDRGGYLRLLQQSFGRVECTIIHDMLRIPYTHVVLRASSL